MSQTDFESKLMVDFGQGDHPPVKFVRSLGGGKSTFFVRRGARAKFSDLSGGQIQEWIREGGREGREGIDIHADMHTDVDVDVHVNANTDVDTGTHIDVDIDFPSKNRALFSAI